MSRQRPAVNPAFAIVIIASVLLILSLVKNAIGLYQSRNRLESARLNVAKLEATKQTLQKDLTLQQDPLRTDQIIRNKLNLSLPGDTLIVITGTNSGLATASSVPKELSLPDSPPYLQWWHLFNP